MRETKKMAVFHDLSGYGRCSLAVALPVIAAMGVQGCPIPTAVLSNHLGFPEWYMKDLTQELPSYIQTWKNLHLEFDGILIGYLGNVAQMDLVRDFVHSFRREKTKVYLDPVMGDHGRLYSSCNEAFCEEMRELLSLSDTIFPNLTEACFLTRTPYREKFSRKELVQMAEELLKMGPSCVVMSGIEEGNFLCNLVCERNSTVHWVKKKKSGQNRPGTGDLFSAIIAAGNLMNQENLSSVSLAAEFIRRAVKRSQEQNTALVEGVCFEKELSFLTRSLLAK
ncbi:MAG: pyridoxamine kinase [bacterium]|nr:pyridoxamine kinase [bacterium]